MGGRRPANSTVEAASPANGSTTIIVAKIVRTIKPAIAGASPNGKDPWQRSRRAQFPPAELPFLRPLSKISSWGGFDAALVVSYIESRERAERIAQAYKIMISGCSQLRTALGERFPETLQHE